MISQKEEIKKLVHDAIESEGFELYDLVFKGGKSVRVLDVFIDHEQGIKVDDCVRFSRKLSDLLDQYDENTFSGYRLNVSSPGIDRPLKKTRDFFRNIGRNVSLEYVKDGKKVSIKGKIISVDNDSVTIDVEGDQVCVNLNAIHQAKVIVAC